MDASTLRGILLGPAFTPRVEDIPTPQLLLDSGVEPDCLRLVSMSARDRMTQIGAMSDDEAVNWAMLIVRTLRLRDGGSADGKGTFVFGKADEQGVSVPDFAVVNALAAQDYDLVNVLGQIVKPFLAVGNARAQLDAQKNDSNPTPSSTGGTDSPTNSDSQQ